MRHASRSLDRPRRLVSLLVWTGLAAGCAPLAQADVVSSPAAVKPNVQITFERTVCFGGCPTFTLRLAGDGKAHLTLPGTRADSRAGRTGPDTLLQIDGQVAPTQVQTLLGTLRQGNFAALEANYRADVSDMPDTVLTLSLPNGTQTTRVHGVPCVAQVNAEGLDPALGPVKPVPDVFCQAAQQLDTIACAVYAAGKDRISAAVQTRFPPRCAAEK